MNQQLDDDIENGGNVWNVYVTMAERTDKEQIESWEKGIDVLLVYVRCFFFTLFAMHRVHS